MFSNLVCVTSKASIFFIIVLVLENPIVHAQSAERGWDYPESGVTLGSGWNSFAGQRTVNSCVEFAEQKDDFDLLAKTSISQVTDKYSLLRQSETSVDAKINSTYGNASAKTSTAKSFKMTADSTQLHLYSTVKKGSTFVVAAEGSGATVKLKDADALLAQTNLAQFVNKCGDGFVSAIQEG
ncbi:MAG: hypothetical protein RJQ14_16770, partial [Marinoscillum sp.]